MKNEIEQRNEAPRLIYYPEVRKLTGLSRSTIWKLEKAGNFPKRRLITTNRVAWLESSVHSWIESRIEVEGAEIQPKHNLPQTKPLASSPPSAPQDAASGEPLQRPKWMDTRWTR